MDRLGGGALRCRSTLPTELVARPRRLRSMESLGHLRYRSPSPISGAALASSLLGIGSWEQRLAEMFASWGNQLDAAWQTTSATPRLFFHELVGCLHFLHFVR